MSFFNRRQQRRGLEISLFESVADRRPGHHVLGAKVRELHSFQEEIRQARESFDAHCEGHDEDVPAGAEPGHGEAEEDEDEEPDDHP